MAAENRAAAELSALDARWVLAVRVAHEIGMSGAPGAGVLAPERRRNLLRLASRLGLRDFDANLVIAIVQDGCRSGGAGEVRANALSRQTSERLLLVRGGAPESRAMTRGELLTWLLASVCLAVTMGLAMARWVSGG